MKHKNYCAEKGCENFQIIEFKDQFLYPWYCKKHRNKNKKNK